jgi:hypothetical protein
MSNAQIHYNETDASEVSYPFILVDTVYINVSEKPATSVFKEETTFTGWSKRLCAPDDYSTKTRKHILSSFGHHDNVVRIRDVALEWVKYQ